MLIISRWVLASEIQGEGIYIPSGISSLPNTVGDKKWKNVYVSCDFLGVTQAGGCSKTVA
jgi:hypothetical protein